jgi:hypothetical protein
VLFGITKHGLGPYATAGYESDMPAFEGMLSDEQIAAVLAYIKSRWPGRHPRPPGACRPAGGPAMSRTAARGRRHKEHILQPASCHAGHRHASGAATDVKI